MHTHILPRPLCVLICYQLLNAFHSCHHLLRVSLYRWVSLICCTSWRLSGLSLHQQPRPAPKFAFMPTAYVPIVEVSFGCAFVFRKRPRKSHLRHRNRRRNSSTERHSARRKRERHYQMLVLPGSQSKSH